MIALVGIVVAGLVRGSDAAAIWAIPVGLLLGTGLGALNGVGIVTLGLPPIVMTLAMNGILQGAALLYSSGTPDGFASPGMRWVMTGRLAGMTPVVLLVAFSSLPPRSCWAVPCSGDASTRWATVNGRPGSAASGSAGR